MAEELAILILSLIARLELHFLRSDYDNFRPGESVSNRQKRIIKQCMQAYDKVGIIRNVIDLDE